MLKEERVLYGYKDVTIIPSATTNIRSRSECNPFILNVKDDKRLPIITAPMSSVVTEEDIYTYEKNYITPILPRNIEEDIRIHWAGEGEWIAVGLEEFERNFCIAPGSTKVMRVCIDVANGHMTRIRDLVQEARKLNPNLIIMAGNIANPRTIVDYCEWGINFARVGIGSGAGCLTSSNTSIHYPMASLIAETRVLRDKFIDSGAGYEIKTEIIADGGIRNYSDVIKALALGADYVMIGGLFAGCYGIGKGLNYSCDIKYNSGKFYSCDKGEEIHLLRNFYGMASKAGQESINPGGKKKTSEGIEKTIPVTITLEAWVENMIHYLRSAMSYCNVTDIIDFYRCSQVGIMSPSAFNSINP